MNISELSIRRPVLATVLTIIILLFGFIGYNYLGLDKRVGRQLEQSVEHCFHML